jgi:hypothetical protein
MMTRDQQQGRSVGFSDGAQIAGSALQVGDQRQKRHAATTPGTAEHIDAEGSFQLATP